ncbi:MAG: BREX-1 system phosphatase PglZ type A, partial [Methanocorpusculum sp.]|nr:BREX-1 system phosphatase PglZ type A [Methanocorpusculum sp.]
LFRSKTKHYYKKLENVYAALEYAVMLLRFSDEIENEGINQGSLNELFSKYSESYYLHDFYYRKFYYHYDKTNDKEILKKDIREIVERDYRRINEKILIKWSNLIESQTNGKWGIELIENQSDFFKIHVSKIMQRNDRDKVAVIISDAMRYEVAAEIKEVLNTSTKGTIELTTMAGCLPSYTKMGMASLLPHKQLEYRNDHIFADGIDSDGLINREKILLSHEKESVAFSFNDFKNLNKEDARQKIKGKRIVYLYHNKIDDTGDNHSSENEVFDAAESAISEISAMVKRLGTSLNVINIIITADHGFIYSRDSLENQDIVETTGFDKDKALITNKRFILSSEDIKLLNTHRFDLKLPSDSAEKMYIYTPYADLRFKLPGGGRNFVHGGPSLQEIVIPVLLYNHNKSKEDLDRKGIQHGKVGIDIFNLKKITSNPFKFRLLQTENVTEKREPLRCKIALYDNSGTKVSDEKTIIADKTSDEPNERILEVMLTMSPNIKNGIYILKAVDEDTKATFGDVLEATVEVDILISDDF